MAATVNSVYQAIRLEHIAGNPPDTDPQRSSETFAQYQARMAAHGLSVDINPTESDDDYLVRLASYGPPVPTEVETSSYALVALNADAAGTAVSSAFASLASTATNCVQFNAWTGSAIAQFAGVAAQATSSLTATNASLATNATSASHAVKADSVDSVSNTASYLDGVRSQLNSAAVDALTITSTDGRGVIATATGTGNAIYGSAVYSQGVMGVQAKVTPLASDINVGALVALRSILDTGSQAITAPVLTVTDQYGFGNGGMISCTNVSTEVFRVDMTGSLWSSGSKGYTGTVSVVAGVTMSFQGGLLINVVA